MNQQPQKYNFLRACDLTFKSLFMLIRPEHQVGNCPTTNVRMECHPGRIITKTGLQNLIHHTQMMMPSNKADARQQQQQPQAEQARNYRNSFDSTQYCYNSLLDSR